MQFQSHLEVTLNNETGKHHILSGGKCLIAQYGIIAREMLVLLPVVLPNLSLTHSPTSIPNTPTYHPAPPLPPSPKYSSCCDVASFHPGTEAISQVSRGTPQRLQEINKDLS